MKIQFIKDYTLTVNNPSCKDGMIGCQPSTTINFKLGQVVSGGIRGGSLDSKNFYIDYGNYTNAIPLEYIKVLNDDGTPYAKSIDFTKMQISDAIEKANQSGQTQGSTTKEPIYYILVTAGVLIAGYFAYKKFKK